MNWRRFWLGFGIVFSAVLIPFGIDSQLNQPQIDFNAQALRVANEIDRLIGWRLNETFSMAAFPSLRAFAASTVETRSQRAVVALNEMQALVASDPQVREVLIVDLSGQALLSTGREFIADWHSRAFLQNALKGQLDVSAVAHDANEYSQYYAAPILDNRGNIAGALVVRVGAQELWSAITRDEYLYAVLTDENGLRLADAGDPTRNLTAWAPLAPEEHARVVNEQTYGLQNPLVSATNFPRAQQKIVNGALDQLQPSDVGASALGARRLVTKSWTVLVLAPMTPLIVTLTRMALPLLVAILFSSFAGLYLSAQ